MNDNTKRIMKLLKVDEKIAIRIEDEMGCDGFRFSECTMREFNKEARGTYDTIQYLDALNKRGEINENNYNN